MLFFNEDFLKNFLNKIKYYSTDVKLEWVTRLVDNQNQFFLFFSRIYFSFLFF